ncbi:efflux RND transporter periplasmic adaptor subunit [Thiomicrorhabdus sp. Kp2]|uniref:efflux RND transporter periplasmic adaptor subunit n=1 Tax=Thiomicrorhabdus sp. Kp2 TaxID=1123518 RepID=UPI000406D027|nr:efflux RND transporter periplasmic adaptor subunit [Thiomicrorhabdus sp. Kp2]
MSLMHKIIGSVLVGVLLSGCQEQTEAPVQIIPVVKTIAINDKSNQPDWSLTGTLSARYQSNLAFRVSGQIEKRLINTGETVQPGQVLFTLDSTDYQLAANIALANIRSTESEIKNAELELERYQKMLSRNLISQQTIDQALTQLTILQERLKAQKLQAQQASNQLNYTQLTSPGLGKVLNIQAEEGEVVAAGQTVAAIALNGAREVSVAVPESRLPGLPKQAMAQIYGSENQYAVELREISDQANSVSRTWNANYAFDMDNQPLEAELNALNLGQTVKVIFKANNALIRIPNTALYEQADFASIWQVKEGKVHRVEVKVLRLSDRWAWVEGDLSGVDRIVSLGVHRLNEGQAVKESEE